MTTITIDRDVVEQALEALTPWMDSDHTVQHAAYHALRAALAQQAEPVEPVAKVELMMTGGNAGLATRIVEIDDHLRERLRPGQLLYTAPPQRKPLTEGALMGVYIDFDRTADTAWSGVEYLLRLCRAIERAHGITDPQVADRLACHGIPMPDEP